VNRYAIGTGKVAAGERLVWVLRHAKAAPDPPAGGGDHERPLAPRGRRDAAALGERLAAGSLGFPAETVPSVALCSTAARTTQTAEAALAGTGTALDLRRRLYYGSPTDVLDELRTLGDEVTSAMVVGHNPTARALAVGLLSAGDAGGREALDARGFPTCSLAVCRVGAPRWRDLAAGTGTLVAFLTPPY
jgi:phosphohistidine phosphatase